MKNNFKYIVCILVLFSSILSFAQTNFVNLTWDQVLLKAKNENKFIFIDLYFTGCFPCAQMDKSVFPDTRVASVMNSSFVAFKSDIFKEEIGKKLARKYGVTGFPSFIVLNPEGKTINVTSGFHKVEELIELLEKSMAEGKNNTFNNYSVNLEADYPEFFNDAYLNNKRQVSFEVVDAYLKSQKDLSDELPFVIITGLRIGGEYDNYVISHANKLANAYGRVPVRNYLSSMVNLKAKQFGNENNEKEFEKLLAQVKPVFTENEWEKFSTDFQKTFEKNKQYQN